MAKLLMLRQQEATYNATGSQRKSSVAQTKSQFATYGNADQVQFDESNSTIVLNVSVPTPYHGLAFNNFAVHNAAQVHIIVPATSPNYLFGGSGLEISIWYTNSCVQAFNLKQLSYTCGSMASTDSCNITFTGLYTAEKTYQSGKSSVSATQTFLPIFSPGGLLMETMMFAAFGDWDGLQSVGIRSSFNGPITPGLAALISMDQVLYDTVACLGVGYSMHS